MKTNKDIYQEFCRQEPGLPIFLNDWWLDAVCVEGPWDVVLAAEKDQVKAVLPYYRVKGRLGHQYLTMPPLTQFLGPWLKYPTGQKPTRRISYEKEVLAELINQLPTFDSFYQKFHYSLTNWLPFYWEDFQQSTGYTYVLEDLTDLPAIFSQFKGSIRTEIRKAEKQVKIKTDPDIEKLFHMVGKTYERQQLSHRLSLELVQRIDTACEKRGCRKMFFALDSSGQVHAAVYLVWDNQSAYLLMTGGDPQWRSSGATTLLIWEALRFTAAVTKKFDFEGSMIKPIEFYFSAFGGVPKPYFLISKTNSRFLKLKKFLEG